MARAARQLTVEFKGDTTDLVHAANDSEKALGSVGHAASGPGGLLSKLTPVVDPISLVTQGLSAAASMAMDFATAASEDAKSAAQVAGVMKNVTNATKDQIAAADDWLGRLSLQTAIADDELRPAFSRLIAATKDVGTAQADLTIALDIAAGTGKDYNAIVDAMVKAQNGNLGGFAKLGIATKDAAGNQLSLNQILDIAKQKWGGLAAQVADQDPMAKAQIAWGELQESLGKFLLPVLQQVVDLFVQKIYPALQDTVRIIKEEVGPTVDKYLRPAVEQLNQALDKLGAAFGEDNGAAFLLSITVKILQGAVIVLAGWIAGLAQMIDTLSTVITWAKIAWQQFAAMLTGPVVSAISTVLSWFGDAWRVGVDVARFITDAWSKMADVISGLTDPIRSAWDALFSWIRKVWNNTLGKLSFHIPGTNIGFDVPDIPGRAAGAVPSAGSSFSVPSAPSITVNLPPGADGHAVVAALRTYGLRTGGLDLTAAATR